MYLYLKKKNPKTFLVPCYDMDLIWHSHQVTGLRLGQKTKLNNGELT